MFPIDLSDGFKIGKNQMQIRSHPVETILERGSMNLFRKLFLAAGDKF